MNQLKELIKKLGQDQADKCAKVFFNDADAFVSEIHLFNGVESVIDIDMINQFIAWVDSN